MQIKFRETIFDLKKYIFMQKVFIKINIFFLLIEKIFLSKQIG